MSTPVWSTDVLVIGSGVAGLSAALAAAPARVTVLTKARAVSGSTPWAQGGLAAAVGPDDAPALHAADTTSVGCGLTEAGAVRLLTSEGPDRVAALLAWGAAFDRDGNGDLALGREAAHSVRRIVHAADATGAEIARTLLDAVTRSPSIEVVEDAHVVELVRSDEGQARRAAGRVVGAVVDTGSGERRIWTAGAVILATGGVGRLFAATTNPPEATGDGLALAARAGATLRDLEMVQFHPTALAVTGADPLPLLSEALRGEGAVLVDETGRRFLRDVHPDAELAPRDVVAQAIARHRLAGHETFLLPGAALWTRLADEFPTAWRSCRAHGIDPLRQPIPVTPAAHYHMGGVATTETGRTDVPGLYAAGEVAATGVHGANRLASNSLLEGLVFGARAGAAAATVAADRTHALDQVRAHLAGMHAAASTRPEADADTDTDLDAIVVAEIRSLMWRHVGLLRDGAGLTEAIARLDELDARSPGALGPAAASLLLVARLVTASACERTESRGAHQRTDHPDTDRSPYHVDLRMDLEHPGEAVTVRRTPLGTDASAEAATATVPEAAA